MGNDILRMDARFDEFAVDASAESEINSAHRFSVKFPPRFAGFFLAANAIVKRQLAGAPSFNVAHSRGGTSVGRGGAHACGAGSAQSATQR
jgi:hypothetical protein